MILEKEEYENNEEACHCEEKRNKESMVWIMKKRIMRRKLREDRILILRWTGNKNQ